MFVTLFAALTAVVSSASTAGTPSFAATPEEPLLSGHVQLTSRSMFVKAGEAYFDPATEWIAFQAVPLPPAGGPPDDFYSMYAAKLVKSDGGAVTGIETPILVSPPGSWNSCAWFHPQRAGELLFSSTLVGPASDQKGGFQVGTRKYQWLFPDEAEVVSVSVPQIALASGAGAAVPPPAPVLTLPDYQAECSYSRDGRYILYAGANGMDPNGRKNIDIFVYDSETARHIPLVQAPGYDGGPFFSPDGAWITYRSDRALNDLLQVFAAEIDFDDAGVPIGIKREVQLTANDAVNWAPYWHPSGEFLVYGTSEVGHSNYEVFAVEADLSGPTGAPPRRARVTQADGADVLPVFSVDGRWMMWTAQRGPLAEGETRPSSQLWIAEWAADGKQRLFSAGE